ncbi:MAG TPA: hypothetical protein VFT59_00925 [Candidatus Saccharimonadales bacterium]|nr:hypothetical protein [Candidatus Saccharimonadales bacterium]
MRRMIRNWIAAIIFAASLGGATLVVATPHTASAAACTDRLLTFPTWYRGVSETVGSDCNIKNPNEVGGLPTFIWKIVLNVIEIMLQLVGLISVGYIITGGFKYLTSTGTADDIVKARKTITNAIVGLVISIFSVAIVNVVAGTI